jgi:hypothetical protein
VTSDNDDYRDLYGSAFCDQLPDRPLDLRRLVENVVSIFPPSSDHVDELAPPDVIVWANAA